jgi:hypothetical protein
LSGKRFKTKDIRLASLIWSHTGECPELQGDFPKTFVFSHRPGLGEVIKKYYAGELQEVNVAELFNRYVALRNLASLEGSNDEEG